MLHRVAYFYAVLAGLYLYLLLNTLNYFVYIPVWLDSERLSFLSYALGLAVLAALMFLQSPIRAQLRPVPLAWVLLFNALLLLGLSF